MLGTEWNPSLPAWVRQFEDDDEDDDEDERTKRGKKGRTWK
jgi:hypothetical protein